MFGVTPPPDPRRPVGGAPMVYQAGIVGALLFGLGLVCLILALGLLASLLGSWLSILVVELPLLAGGALGLALGYANLHTRIELRPEGLQIVAPSWRGVPVPPLQHLSVPWSDVRAIRRRTEWQGSRLLRLRIPLAVHAIETPSRRVVLADYYLSELEPVLVEIMTRAGCRQIEDDEVESGILASMVRGSAPWSDARGVAVEEAPRLAGRLK